MTTNRQDLEVLIPNEFSQTALTAVQQTSAVENLGRVEVMTSDTKEIPRFGGFTVGTVAKGAEYGFSTNTPDVVALTARKIGGLAKIAEEDLVDTVTGEATMGMYEREAGTALATFYDNAALGVTAAENGTTVPFTSLYRTLSQAQTSPWGSYTANANIKQITVANAAASTTAATNLYDTLVDALDVYESSIFFEPENTVVIASYGFKSVFRKVKDANGQPVFIDGPQAGNEGTFLGYRARWSRGARLSATASQTPTGNPLLIVGNGRFMVNGRARTSAGMPPGNPGTQWQRAANGVGFTSDEAIMKATMRRAFEALVPQAFVVVEIIPNP